MTLGVSLTFPSKISLGIPSNNLSAHPIKTASVIRLDTAWQYCLALNFFFNNLISKSFGSCYGKRFPITGNFPGIFFNCFSISFGHFLSNCFGFLNYGIFPIFEILSEISSSNLSVIPSPYRMSWQNPLVNIFLINFSMMLLEFSAAV